MIEVGRSARPVMEHMEHLPMALGSRICATSQGVRKVTFRAFSTAVLLEAMREAICIHIGQGGLVGSVGDVGRVKNRRVNCFLAPSLCLSEQKLG